MPDAAGSPKQAESKTRFYSLIVLAVLTIILIAFIIASAVMNIRVPSIIFAIVGSGFGAIIGTIAFLPDQNLLASEEGRKLRENEERLAEEAAGGQLNLADLWAVTQQRIDFYHEVALRQSRQSFRSGQLAMVIGFASVVALGVYAAGFAKSDTTAIAASAVAAVGAAASAYIGATFLKAQAEATAQLRDFFVQPTEFIRMLGAERLVQTLPEQERTAAVNQIIKSMMPQAASPDPAKGAKLSETG